MSIEEFRLKNAPIVEAVVDIDCDLLPGVVLSELVEPAAAAFSARYPKQKTQYLKEIRFHATAEGGLDQETREGTLAYQFFSEDEKQLVQVRSAGFAFNRLAPYSSLDDYLPEIQDTWNNFIRIAKPIQVREIRLRYINRIEIPFLTSRIELNTYFKAGPKLPYEDGLILAKFLIQNVAVEESTGHIARVTLTDQVGSEGFVTVVLDIEVASGTKCAPEDWAAILSELHSLRRLKNELFRGTITDECVKLFQQ